MMLLSVLMVALPQITLVAQSVDDDLYFVPKKEKKTTSEGTEGTTPAYRMESDRTAPAEVRFSSGEVRVSSSSPVVVTDASGVERDVDEYNRRYSSDYTEEPVNDTLYIEDVEEVTDDGEWVNGFSGTEDDYEYATRLIRFRSPRVAVPVSSPLYWDIVYAWPVSDWNVYTDGFYAYAFPTVSNPAWWSWRMDPWHWNYSWSWHGGWGFSFGWGSPWYDPWYAPWHYHSHYYHHHHPHHGFGPAWGGGGHIGGGWRKGFYYDNRPRMASRPNTPRGNRQEAGVRATRGNDRGGVSASRGNVATRGNGRNATATRETRQGRVVSGRSSDTAVRGTTGRGFRIGDADDGNVRTERGQSVSGNNGRQEGTTVRSGRSSSSRSSGNYTRSSSTRRSSTYSGSAATRSSRSSGNVSSSQSSSSGSYTRSSSSSSRSSSGSYSSGGGSSRSSSGSYSSGGGSSRSSSGGGGGRSSGGGGGRSGGGRR